MEIISKDKEYTTRDGRETRIYATDGGGDYPIHGAIKIGGEWKSSSWTIKGVHTVSNFDLIEKPQGHIVKVAFWKKMNGVVGATNLEKDNEEAWRKDEDTLAIKTITFKEGEGL